VNALEFLRANDTNFDITPKTALNNQKNYIYARRDEINDIIYKVSGLEEFFRSGNWRIRMKYPKLVQIRKQSESSTNSD
jgi:hypothetical protein